MPFPLPLDPSFRREVIEAWLDDVDDRLDMGSIEGAKQSWKVAHDLLLSLPPGEGSFFLEKKLVEARVKISRYH